MSPAAGPPPTASSRTRCRPSPRGCGSASGPDGRTGPATTRTSTSTGSPTTPASRRPSTSPRGWPTTSPGAPTMPAEGAMNGYDQQIRSADGTRLVVRRAGAGDPVVLLHGSGGGLHSWATVAERLAGSYELWMPALRGYGPSDVPSGRKSFADEVVDMVAVTEAAGSRVHLVGGSYGAVLALHTAVAEPGRLRSLALFEPPLFAAGKSIEPLLDRYRAALQRDDTAEMSAVRNEVTRVPA